MWWNRDGSWSSNAAIIAAKEWGCTPLEASLELFERTKAELATLGPQTVSFTLQGNLEPIWQQDIP